MTANTRKRIANIKRLFYFAISIYVMYLGIGKFENATSWLELVKSTPWLLVGAWGIWNSAAERTNKSDE